MWVVKELVSCIDEIHLHRVSELPLVTAAGAYPIVGIRNTDDGEFIRLRLRTSGDVENFIDQYAPYGVYKRSITESLRGKYIGVEVDDKSYSFLDYVTSVKIVAVNPDEKAYEVLQHSIARYNSLDEHASLFLERVPDINKPSVRRTILRVLSLNMKCFVDDSFYILSSAKSVFNSFSYAVAYKVDFADAKAAKNMILRYSLTK